MEKKQTLYTSDEMAEALQITKRRLLLLVKRGDVPVIKMGHRLYRYNPQAVLEALQRRQQDKNLTEALASLQHHTEGTE